MAYRLRGPLCHWLRRRKRCERDCDVVEGHSSGWHCRGSGETLRWRARGRPHLQKNPELPQEISRDRKKKPGDDDGGGGGGRRDWGPTLPGSLLVKA